MGIRTTIGWCDSTLSLVAGCSLGCELSGGHCYAEAWCARYAGRKGYPKDFHKPECFLHRFDQALRWKDLTGTKRPDKPWLDGRPRVIFLNELGETFDPALPTNWLAWCLPGMAASPHILIILTKQAERMAQFSTRHLFPANVWLGVSVTSGKALGRISQLHWTFGHKRIASFEPLLGPVHTDLRGLDWIIIGGESGPNRRPCEVGWIESLVEQAHDAGIPAFVKQDSALRPGQQGRIPDELWRVKEIP